MEEPLTLYELILKESQERQKLEEKIKKEHKKIHILYLTNIFIITYIITKIILNTIYIIIKGV